MRIGFNAYFLQKPMTGSGQYARSLLATLARSHPDQELVLIEPASAKARKSSISSPMRTVHNHSSTPSPLRSRERAGVSVNPALPENVGPGGPIGPSMGQGDTDAYRFRHCSATTPFDGSVDQLSKVWFEQFAVPAVARRERAEIVHYPYFAAPLLQGSRAPDPPVVVTIHDVIPLLLAPYRGSPLVRLYMRLVSAAARRAAAIITDSESSKADIVRVLGIPPEHISVIYLAVDEQFGAPGMGQGESDRAEAREVARRYGLREDFVLYMGGLDARKNVVALVEAFAEVRRQRQDEALQLAIAGQPVRGDSLFPDIERAARQNSVADAVVFLGAVPDADRPSLYSAARAFVFPSLYEGFGLPPLEAMACGTPVICSNRSSLPEVVGDAAILFEPTDRRTLVEALLEVLMRDELRAKLRQRGFDRVQLFSWERAARETLRTYEAIARAQQNRGL